MHSHLTLVISFTVTITHQLVKFGDESFPSRALKDGNLAERVDAAPNGVGLEPQLEWLLGCPNRCGKHWRLRGSLSIVDLPPLIIAEAVRPESGEVENLLIQGTFPGCCSFPCRWLIICHSQHYFPY